MDADRARIVEIAESARRLPIAERRAFIDGFRLDPESRRAVESRLASDPTRIMRRDEAAEPTIALQPDAGDAGAAARDAPAASPRAVVDALDPLLGRTFGGVAVERIVGSGGMGRVYLGTDSATGGRVALKVLLRTQRDESVRRRFDREGRLLEKLRHPGIAGVLRTGIEQDADVDVPFIVMEYVEGARGIADHVFRERLGTRETIEAFLQACDAVGHAHREGYVHRDIKPPNILVDRHGRVKVIDFGVARAISVDPSAQTIRTETGQIVGTMQYMSPEQFMADPRGIDARTDVYALSAVLYELLTGVQPHDLRGLPVHEAARVVCETDAADVRHCNPRLDQRLAAIVMDGLAREKSRRPDDACALALRLRGWLADSSGSGVATATAVAPVPAAGEDRTRVMAGAGGVVRVDPATPVPARARSGGLGWFPVSLLVLLVAGALAVAFAFDRVQAAGARLRALWSGTPAAEDTARQRAEVAERAAGSVKLAELRVVTAPPGAEIRVDGEPRGRSPAVVLLPAGAAHRVEASLEGWAPARAEWRDGDPALGLNLDPAGDPPTLPRVFAIDAGTLPRGAVLRATAPVSQAVPAGTSFVAVTFERAADGTWSAPPLVLEAKDAGGRPLRIEHGTRESVGTAEIPLRPDDAGTRLRIRVR